jgi:argonaute-like protein implicated in RNA metabolism and viral defense
MATDKLFKVAGISKLNGEYKVRFANDIMRIKVLAKSGHEDIRLAELDVAVSKMEAALLISAMDEFSDVIAQATISEYVEENTPRAPKAKTAPVKAPVKAKATKTVTKAELEDAPF